MDTKERADFHVHLGERSDDNLIQEARQNGVTKLAVLDREIVRVERLKQLITKSHTKGVTILPGVEVLTAIPYDHQMATIELLGLDFDLDHPGIHYYFDPQGESYAPKHHHKVRFQKEYLEKLGLCLNHTEENLRQWETIQSGSVLDTAIRLCKIAASDPTNNDFFNGNQTDINDHLAKRPQDQDAPTAKYLFWQHFAAGQTAYTGWQQEKAHLIATGKCQPDLDAPSLIQLFHDAGGVVIIPHPHFRHKEGGTMPEILSHAFAMGVDGVECWDADLLDRPLAKCILQEGKLVLGGSGQDTTYYSNRVMGKGDINKQRMYISPIRLNNIRSYKQRTGISSK